MGAFGTPPIDPRTNGNPLLEWERQTGQQHPLLAQVRQKMALSGTVSPTATTPTLAPPQAAPPPLTSPSANGPASVALASNDTATSHPAVVPASTPPGTTGSPATGAPAPAGTPAAVPATALNGSHEIPHGQPSTALSAAPNTPAKAEYDRLVKTGSGESQIKNPWARVPLQVLDAIGSAFFPSLTMGIPGTQLHHDVLVNQARRGVTEEADVGEKEARAEHERAEAANAKTTSQTPHTLQTAEGIMQWNPDTKRFDIPAGQPPVKEEEEGRTVTTDQGVMQWDPKTKTYGIKVGNAPEKEGAEKTLQDSDGVWYHIGKDNTATPITVNGKPFQGKVPAEKTENQEQKFIDEYMADPKNVKNGAKPTIAEAQRAFKKNEQLPPQTDRGQNFIDPSTNKLVRVEPGGAVPKGALTAAGENTLNTPTAQTRTMAEAAPKVLDLANRVGQLVDQQEKALGPAASRWSEFMAGKVGAPNADFTKLRTDVMLLQTILMRMHVGARGGENMMEHFRSLIDVSKQSPENLRAALEEIRSYAQAVGGKAVEANPPPGGGTGGKSAEGGYQIGHKYGGMVYQGGPVNDKANWK